jgi:hypothetical protein
MAASCWTASCSVTRAHTLRIERSTLLQLLDSAMNSVAALVEDILDCLHARGKKTHSDYLKSFISSLVALIAKDVPNFVVCT